MGVNSFVGHRFFATPEGSQRRGTTTAQPLVVEVARAKQKHDFGPDGEDAIIKVDGDALEEEEGGEEEEQAEDDGESDAPPNPRVKIIGHRTTAMNARFRCLTPYPVDYYYDDGKDGVMSGSLSLGKESSVRHTQQC